jgi:5'-nucleotidase
VTRKSAHNLIIQSEAFTNAAGMRVVPTTQLPQFTPHPEVARIVATYKAASAEQAARQITRLPQSITRAGTPSGETALGNLIADAQWAATAPADKGAADFALMNPGGVRADLIVAPGGGAVNYGQLFSIQPFGNTLTVKTFTGQLVKELLESQYRQDRPRVLYPSAQLTYQVDLKQPVGQRVSDIRIKGQDLQLNARYRVTMNSFLATGGDAFSVFNRGTDVLGGDLDVDALTDYLAKNPGLTPPQTGRIRVY